MALDPTSPPDDFLVDQALHGGLGATPVVFAQEWAQVGWALACARGAADLGEVADAVDAAAFILAILAAQFDAVFAADLGV